MASVAPTLAKRSIDEATQSLPHSCTLLELVQAVAEGTDDDREIVAAVISMLLRGRVVLSGNFRGEPIEKLVR